MPISRRWPLGKGYRLFGGAAAILAAVVIGAILIFAGGEGKRDSARPALGLMTTLPLFWAEGDLSEIVQQARGPSPAYQRLGRNYRLRLIDAVDARALAKMDLLLLAQPRALAASELAALDRWVRGGGHMLIMADPALQWDSAYPLGDKRRPLFTSMMSPLFVHWGLELVLPIDEDAAAAAVRQHGEYSLRTETAGAWQKRRGGSGDNCAISADGLAAECAIGKGSAVLIADADMLNDIFWAGSGVRALSGSDDFDNMRWVEANLERLRSHRVGPGNAK